jgi:hypothetical protein
MSDAVLPQKPGDVRVSKAPPRGRAPEIRENTSGTTVHPMVA